MRQVVLQPLALCQVCQGYCWEHGMVLTSTDVANAVKCTTVTLNGFTVPAKKTLTLNLATGTTVTMSECPIFRTRSSY